MMAKERKTEIVKSFILEEVKAGRIKDGQRLPSCREVSSLLTVNKITVNKAYHELEREHKVYSIPRGGFYLIEPDRGQGGRPAAVDFRTVRPEERLIPYREFTHAITRAIDMDKDSLFGYEATGGLVSLRETLRAEFERDGVYCSADSIIISHGAQQAISLVIQSLLRAREGKLLVEVPTYNLVLKMANHLGIELAGIERKAGGFDNRQLEVLFKSGQISAFYVIPNHHNPTGYSLGEKTKQKIVELSCKYNVLIIEDDYLADLGSRKGALPIHYYDVSKGNVYIRSFSKTFMPGIRLGAAVVPKPLFAEVATLKHVGDLNTSKILQAALNLFIRSGMYEKHVKKVKRSYETKLMRATEILRALSPPDLEWHVPQRGIFIWLKLPDRIDAVGLERRLEQQGILIQCGAEFFPNNWPWGNPQGSVRLCISGVTEGELDSLADIIAAIRGY